MTTRENLAKTIKRKADRYNAGDTECACIIAADPMKYSGAMQTWATLVLSRAGEKSLDRPGPDRQKERSSGMTPKQLQFCEEYLIDLNATQAAIRAGYSTKTAKSEGSRLLTNADIQTEITKLQEARAKRVQITQDQVLTEYGKLAFSNMQDYICVQEDGTAYVDLSKLTRDQGAAIQEIHTEEEVEGRAGAQRTIRKVKFKLAEKKGALDSLARHLGIFAAPGSDSEPGLITYEQLEIIVRRRQAERMKELKA